MRRLYRLFRDATFKFFDDRAPRLGAAMAFYSALSLSPLLLVVVGMAGVFLGAEAAQGGIASQIRDLVGEEGAKAVEAMLANSVKDNRGLFPSIVGITTLLIGATGVFAQLKDALDVVWHVPTEKQASTYWSLLWDRVLSFSVICGMAFLLLVSLLFSAAMSGFGQLLNRWFPNAALLTAISHEVLSFILTSMMFSIIFKVLPNARPQWSEVWFGAFVTAGLFSLGKSLIGLYLGKAAIGSAYGAAGSFVALLIWIYYSTQILLFGAELTSVHSSRLGRPDKPGQDDTHSRYMNSESRHAVCN